jgi:hypothetical protein
MPVFLSIRIGNNRRGPEPFRPTNLMTTTAELGTTGPGKG